MMEAAYLLLTLGAALASGWADKSTDFHKGKSKYLNCYFASFVVSKSSVSCRGVCQVRKAAAVMAWRPFTVIMCCEDVHHNVCWWR